MKTKLKVLFFLLIFAAPGMLKAEEPAADTAQANITQALPEVQTYEQLVSAIRKAGGESQARVEQAVQQEKVRECWEIGKLIDEHVLRHKERADYGKQVILRLSQDLSVSDTELYYMLEFARAYPNFRAPGKLSWGHYQTLLSMNDPKERAELEEKASKENWSQDQLRAKVKESKAAKGTSEKGSDPEKERGSDPFSQPGKPGTYRMVKATVGPEIGRQVIDLGFSNYYRTSRNLGFKEGAIIEALFAMPEGSTPSDKVKLSKRTPDDLYTYRAYVHRVLDGDTIEAVIDLGFGVRSVQTLRLRGIDAPELVSKEGKEAKEALEKMLGVANSSEPIADSQENSATRNAQRTTGVLIRTVKSDKYDRYLADIWIALAPNGQGQLRQELDVPVRAGVYVNQALVEHGFAVRVKES